MIERAVCPALIGREDELSALEDTLLDAGRGEGRVALLAGDAGVGKTRLASQLRWTSTPTPGPECKRPPLAQ